MLSCSASYGSVPEALFRDTLAPALQALAAVVGPGGLSRRAVASGVPYRSVRSFQSSGNSTTSSILRR